MAQRKHKTVREREYHLSEVARLYLEGKYQSEIAIARAGAQQQISQDLQIIQARWRESALRDFDALKQEQLAKIDHAEREAWAAWYRSQEDKEVVYSEEGGTSTAIPAPPDNKALTVEDVEAFVATLSKKPPKTSSKQYTRREGQVGDPRFLDMALKCVERRCKLLGLDMPQRIELAGADGGAVRVQMEGNLADAIANLGTFLKDASPEARTKAITEYEHFVEASDQLRQLIATVGQPAPVESESAEGGKARQRADDRSPGRVTQR